MALTYTDLHPLELAQSGVAVGLTPAIDVATGLASTAPIEVQRAPDSSGSPNVGSAVTVANPPMVTPSGVLYLDPLPLTANRYWYRFRHVQGAGVGTWSAWLGPFEAVEIPKDVLAAARSGPALTATLYPAWTQATARPGTHTQQLLPNFGFEDGSAFWAPAGGLAVVLTDNTKAHSGNRYLQLTSTTGVAADAVATDDAGQQRYFEVNPGDVVQWGGWIYRESGTANVFFELDTADKDKGGAVAYNTPNQNTAAWVFVQGELVIPAGVKYVRFFCAIDTTGTGTVARYDDVFLRIAFGSSTVLNRQGTMLPIPADATIFGFNAGGGTNTHMWGCINTSAGYTLRRPDGSTLIAAATNAYDRPAAPTLSQVAAGALGARTYFVRTALVKKSGAGIGYATNYRTSPESSLAVSANNVLKVTSPATVAGYDGWMVWVGTAANGEINQQDFAAGAVIPFGTDWIEPTVGAVTSSTLGTPYNSVMDSGFTIGQLLATTTYKIYLYYDPLVGIFRIGFSTVGSPTTTADEGCAQEQNADGHIGLSFGSTLNLLTPGAGGSGSGAGSGQKYK